MPVSAQRSVEGSARAFKGHGPAHIRAMFNGDFRASPTSPQVPARQFLGCCLGSAPSCDVLPYHYVGTLIAYPRSKPRAGVALSWGFDTRKAS